MIKCPNYEYCKNFLQGGRNLCSTCYCRIKRGYPVTAPKQNPTRGESTPLAVALELGYSVEFALAFTDPIIREEPHVPKVWLYKQNHKAPHTNKNTKARSRFITKTIHSVYAKE